MLGPRKRLDLRNKSPKERDKKFSSGKYRSFNLDQDLVEESTILMETHDQTESYRKKCFRM
jgi:hypothetical protein